LAGGVGSAVCGSMGVKQRAPPRAGRFVENYAGRVVGWRFSFGGAQLLWELNRYACSRPLASLRGFERLHPRAASAWRPISCGAVQGVKVE